MNRSPIKRWLPAITLSVLFHVIAIVGTDFKFPPVKQTSRIPAKLITLYLEKPHVPMKQPLLKKASVDALKPAPKTTTNNSGLVRKNTPVIANHAKKLNDAHATKDPANAANSLAAKPENRAKPTIYRDWQAMTKSYIQEKFAGEASQKLRQEELWLKAPSIMHGSPPDHFDKQNKAAMLAETEPQEKKRLKLGYRKSPDLGIQLGKSCYLGDLSDEKKKDIFRCHWPF